MTMAPLLGRLLLLTCGGFLLVHHTGAVIELTDQNFYDYAKDREVLLVDFFAPWCGDCKALDPDLENAATSLGTRSIDLAKVDCFGAGKGLCSTYGVKRWPTLKNFNRGQYTGDYTGGLSTAELAGYITTVENSVNPVNPVVNPYAAPFMPVAAAAVTQQCVSRCKISRITNKTPCYARCKGPKPLGRKVLPQPVINEKSCAKCRQPQIAGKFRKKNNKGTKTISKRSATDDTQVKTTTTNVNKTSPNDVSPARSLFINVRVTHENSNVSLAGDMMNVLKWASGGENSVGPAAVATATAAAAAAPVPAGTAPAAPAASVISRGSENHPTEQNVDENEVRKVQETSSKRDDNVGADKKSQTEILEVIQDRKLRRPHATTKLVGESATKVFGEQSNQTSIVEVIGVTRNKLGLNGKALSNLKRHDTLIPGELAYATSIKRTFKSNDPLVVHKGTQKSRPHAYEDTRIIK